MNEPKHLGIADAKQRLLKIVDDLPEEGVLLTKRGKVVARLTPMRPATLAMFGALKGKVKVHGDIVDTSDLSADFMWTADETNAAASGNTKSMNTRSTAKPRPRKKATRSR
jgi:antitoxin (DNA-binding transcriptional repressor) of toxin-antitoxin stability system